MNTFATKRFSSQGLWDFGTESTHATRYANEFNEIVDGWGCNKLFKRNLTNSSVSITNYHLYQVISKTNDWKSYLNGTLFATNDVNCTPGFPTTPTIGRSGTSGSFKYFSGNIAEVLIFTNSLTTDQDATVRNYLKNKYNLW